MFGGPSDSGGAEMMGVAVTLYYLVTLMQYLIIKTHDTIKHTAIIWRQCYLKQAPGWKQCQDGWTSEMST